jgi:hypothetical protein
MRRVVLTVHLKMAPEPVDRPVEYARERTILVDPVRGEVDAACFPGDERTAEHAVRCCARKHERVSVAEWRVKLNGDHRIVGVWAGRNGAAMRGRNIDVVPPARIERRVLRRDVRILKPRGYPARAFARN